MVVFCLYKLVEPYIDGHFGILFIDSQLVCLSFKVIIGVLYEKGPY